MDSNQRKLQEIGNQLGLTLDAQLPCLFTTVNGYTICVQRAAENQPLIVSVSVNYQGMMPDAQALQAVTQYTKTIANCTVHGYRADYTIRAGMTQKKTVENLSEALNTIVGYLQSNGFVNCCEHDGTPTTTRACNIAGKSQLLCLNSFQQLQQEAHDKNLATPDKPENIIGGIIGALIGSLIGVVVIVLLGQLGFVAALSGLVMGFCAVKGYELLGHKLDTKGIIITVVIMVIMVYFGERLDWAISVERANPGVGVIPAFQAIPELIAKGYIESGTYYGDMAMQYLFMAIGAVPTIIAVVKNKGAKNQFYVMAPAGQPVAAGVADYAQQGTQTPAAQTDIPQQSEDYSQPGYEQPTGYEQSGASQYSTSQNSEPQDSSPNSADSGPSQNPYDSGFSQSTSNATSGTDDDAQ